MIELGLYARESAKECTAKTAVGFAADDVTSTTGEKEVECCL